jgi:hypothetical protein
MYYIEFYDRQPGVSLERFHEVTLSAFPEWSRRYPEDEIVANIGRTWRLGRDPYMLIWSCRGFERWNEWDDIFHSNVVDDLEVPLLDVMSTYRTGFYEDLGSARPRPKSGPFYVELFEPSAEAADSYESRAQAAGIALSLLVTRIGLLGPDPAGLALFTLSALSDVERLQASTPEWVESVGTYDLVGREIL